MPFRTEKFITRRMLRANPETLFAFGDNMKARGFGGQAAEMRGEPNAVGIPTKWVPSNTENSFFCDGDFPAVRGLIEERLQCLKDHLKTGGDVVWPEDGIGTGLAQLMTRAPRVFTLINAWRISLEQHRR
jgi:hypothetical protein